MRTLTLITTAGLLLTALALVPDATADPLSQPPTCSEERVVDGFVRVDVRSDCSLYVAALTNVDCVGAWATTVQRDVGPHTVRASVCDGGLGYRLGQLIGDLVVGPAAQPGCHVQTIEKEGPFGTNRVEVAHNCRTSVTLNEGIICLGGAVEKREFDLNVVHVTYYGCGSPNAGGGPGDLIALGAAQPCREFFGTSVLVQVETHEDCAFETHFIDAYRVCTMNLAGFESDRVGATAGLATASVGYCHPGLATPQSAMADPFPTCVTEPCGPGLPPGPTAPCTRLQANGSGTFYEYDLDAGCNLYVQVQDCVWDRYWGTTGAGPVRVNLRDCKDVAEAQSQMADPFPTCVAYPCGPLPPQCPNVNEPGQLSGIVDVRSIPYTCSYEVTVGNMFACTEPLGGSVHEELGHFTVTVPGCGVGSVTQATPMQDPDPRPAECPGVATAYPWNQYVSVTVYEFGCRVRVDTLGGFTCPTPLDGTTSVSRGSTTVTAHCTPSLATAAAPTCKPVERDPVEVTSSCRVVVELDYMQCLWGGRWTERSVGPVTVRVYTCDGNPPDTSSAAAPACKPTSQQAGTATVTVDSGCSVLVRNRMYECLWGGSYVTVAQVGPVTVQDYRCTPPYETQ